MECRYCHGLVIWKGPLTNLTHTECQNCGAINSQFLEQEYEEEMEFEIDVNESNPPQPSTYTDTPEQEQ